MWIFQRTKKVDWPCFLPGPPRSSWVLLGPLARGSEKVLACPWSPLVPPVHLQAALLASRATAPQPAAVQGPAPPFIKSAATILQIPLLLLLNTKPEKPPIPAHYFFPHLQIFAMFVLFKNTQVHPLSSFGETVPIYS